ncbi:MAG TPA: PTS sugar transporter subunit IIA [Burkholderiales bacterium]|nr:PTS sugar transporter subunit IIA [Burkholderiales bacterium]
MSLIGELLSPNDILLGVEASSKERVFDAVGRLLQPRCGFAQAQLVDSLVAREACGSTGIGHGVAIPHARIKGLARPVGVYVRTRLPIPFDAPDGKPVSDLIVLLVPEQAAQQHLRLLGEVAEIFGDASFRQRLRSTADPLEVHRLLSEWGRL